MFILGSKFISNFSFNWELILFSYNILWLQSLPPSSSLQIHLLSVFHQERTGFWEITTKYEKIRYNNMKQNCDTEVAHSNPSGGEKPQEQHKGQRHTCSPSQASHKNTKLKAILYTRRTCADPVLSASVAVSSCAPCLADSEALCSWCPLHTMTLKPPLLSTECLAVGLCLSSHQLLEEAHMET